MFDFKNPDYRPIIAQRLARLRNLRSMTPAELDGLRAFYRAEPIQFIEDWGITYDPRLITRKLSPLIPIVLFPRQREFLEWMLRMWHEDKFGISDKSRDMGLSWMCVALASAMCLFNSGFAWGFGSRKELLVDKQGDPDSLFYKLRMFLSHVPYELRGGWKEGAQGCDKHMLITIPDTSAVIRGEAGDNIGRGGRSSIYVKDEDAFLERPHKIDAALSQNTNCCIGISSVNGMDNPFAEKRHSWPEDRIFTFAWRDDPRKDDVWYTKQKENLNPLIVAQEIDLDYSASKSGIVIPSAWVQAAIGAAQKLGISVTGARRSALDVADEGIDLNAWAMAYGIEIQTVESWSGQGSDIYATTNQAFLHCDMYAVPTCRYDSDGLGAGVRGDAANINNHRPNATREFIPFRGSGAVVDPQALVFKGDNKGVGARTNEDFFLNAKAQAWWSLRTRFEATYKAITKGIMPEHPDDLISISPAMPSAMRTKLVAELSQPTYSITTAGKLIIDKAPEGSRSPNLADAVNMLFAPMATVPRGFFG